MRKAPGEAPGPGHLGLLPADGIEVSPPFDASRPAQILPAKARRPQAARNVEEGGEEGTGRRFARPKAEGRRPSPTGRYDRSERSERRESGARPPCAVLTCGAVAEEVLPHPYRPEPLTALCAHHARRVRREVIGP